MARARAHLTCFLALLLLSSVAFAKTWYVGGSGADFDEIQPAIDAASDGDVILVRPVKVYQTFTLAKGLVVRATTGRFDVAGDYSTVAITGIAAGKAAKLGGAHVYVRSVALSIGSSAGEVGIEDSAFVSDGRAVIQISDCTNVHLNQLEVACSIFSIGDAPAVLIWNSRVQLSQATIRGGGNPFWDSHGDGIPGSPALEVEGSRVVLARPEITGGNGGDGDSAPDCSQTHPGGDGGPGVIIVASDVLVLGDPTDFIHGGDGGSSGHDSWGDCGLRGGDGGPGILSNVGTAHLSAIELEGGYGGWAGNYSCPSPCGKTGSKGPPFSGPGIDFISPYFPVLLMDGGLHPGRSFQIDIHQGEVDATLVLLFSSQRGWIDIKGVPGAPFATLPGAWFVGVAAGKIPAGGSKTITLTLPDDPSVKGFAITAQAALLGQVYAQVLTNAVTRIIGD
jgi:hypothetical protein